ncbi:MAG: hypothetical protein RLO18_07575, partial [Gimesia chilikensis]
AINILPHTKQLTTWANAYLRDVETLAKAGLNRLNGDKDFRLLYKVCLATDLCFRGLAKDADCPGLDAARNLVARIPMLASLNQTSSVLVELRRLIELIAWTIYFTDHPVEWRQFSGNETREYANRQDRPIEYCAHRPLKYYLDYICEFLDSEPSGLAIAEVSRLRAIGNDLSFRVHAA